MATVDQPLPSDVHNGVPRMQLDRPTCRSDNGDVQWLQSHPRTRAQLPTTSYPFTLRATDRQTIDAAKRAEVVRRVGYVQPHTMGIDRTYGRPTPLYQLTQTAYEWLSDHSVDDDFSLPCDCETRGFVNVGTVERAPFDEDYYGCKVCGRLFPESDVR